MSIQSEIARLSKNISDSLDAVAAKGVTVPSGSNSDDLPGLIEAISAGSQVIIDETEDSHGGTIVTITADAAFSSQSKTATPTTSQQTVTPDEGYLLSSVTINAMPTGTAGTPTATKGTVSNHSVSVTPSVTNTTGYITGGTKTGTAVTVSASELVSGSQTITDNGTVNVTNLASVTVAIPIQHYYTGSSDPPSSLGQNGDIYLKVVS